MKNYSKVTEGDRLAQWKGLRVMLKRDEVDKALDGKREGARERDAKIEAKKFIPRGNDQHHQIFL